LLARSVLVCAGATPGDAGLDPFTCDGGPWVCDAFEDASGPLSLWLLELSDGGAIAIVDAPDAPSLLPEMTGFAPPTDGYVLFGPLRPSSEPGASRSILAFDNVRCDALPWS
jgi:hypothetical protein